MGRRGEYGALGGGRKRGVQREREVFPGSKGKTRKGGDAAGDFKGSWVMGVRCYNTQCDGRRGDLPGRKIRIPPRSPAEPSSASN